MADTPFRNSGSIPKCLQICSWRIRHLENLIDGEDFEQDVHGGYAI